MGNHCIDRICGNCGYEYCLRCEWGKCPKCGQPYEELRVKNEKCRCRVLGVENVEPIHELPLARRRKKSTTAPKKKDRSTTPHTKVHKLFNTMAYNKRNYYETIIEIQELVIPLRLKKGLSYKEIFWQYVRPRWKISYRTFHTYMGVPAKRLLKEMKN